MATAEQTVAAIDACLQKFKVGGAKDAGVKLVERNRVVEVAPDQRPALILLESDTGTGSEPIVLRSRMNLPGPGAEDEIELEIWGEIEASAAAAGPAIRTLENKVIEMFATDTDLNVLGPHFSVKKKRTVKHFASGDNVIAFFGLTVVVTFVLQPTHPNTA